MSTKQCPSCGGAVSPQASVCPHCGHPLKRAKGQIGCFGVVVVCIIGYAIYRVLAGAADVAATATTASASTTCAASDAQCVFADLSVRGAPACRRAIEQQAQYDVKWSDGILHPMFDTGAWGGSEHASMILSGDRVQMQNGFGAWKPMQYYCKVNVTSGVVEQVEIVAGRRHAINQ